MEISTTVRSIPTEVPLGRADGMPNKCVANADNLATIPKVWLEKRIAALRANKRRAVDDALRFALGLHE